MGAPVGASGAPVGASGAPVGASGASGLAVVMVTVL